MIAEYIAVLLFVVASSGDVGFRFVQMLGQIQQWIEEFAGKILGLDYQAFWLLAAIPFLLVWGWIGWELRQIRKALTAKNTKYTNDDFYDEVVQ